MKAESGGSVEESGKELGSVQQEARTCPVCGTKFFATADNGFCPVCILRGATGGESTAAREPGSVSGSAGGPEEKEDTSEPRRLSKAGRNAVGASRRASTVFCLADLEPSYVAENSLFTVLFKMCIDALSMICPFQ